MWQDLPLELIEKIATTNSRVWKIVVLISKNLAAKFNDNEQFRDCVLSKFLATTITVRKCGNRIIKETSHTLPNGWFHSPTIAGDKQPGVEIDTAGYQTRIWYYLGKIHRPLFAGEHFPAFIKTFRDSAVCQKWYWHGELHRIPGSSGMVCPAIIHRDGTVAWYRFGKYHSPILATGERGPAIIMANGTRYWCLAGAIYKTEPASIRQHICHIAFED